MDILLIEPTNFVDFPMGGILSFYNHVLAGFPDRLALAGYATDSETPVGVWSKKKIGGRTYDYFAFKRVIPSSARPLVPARLSACWALRKYRKQILSHPHELIMTATFASLLALPHRNLKECVVVLPGVEITLRHSRYFWAKPFADLYAKLLYRRLSKTRKILAAADRVALDEFVRNSHGILTGHEPVQFPTR